MAIPGERAGAYSHSLAAVETVEFALKWLRLGRRGKMFTLVKPYKQWSEIGLAVLLISIGATIGLPF